MCLKPKMFRGMFVPCRKCVECQMNKAKQWAFRIALESSLYKENCMITLTYNEANIPKGDTLQVRDLQLFVKRLRKHLKNDKIRYFACGEYGSTGGRPHYHIIVFNYKPSDLYYFFTDKKGTELYRSPTIEKLWSLGFSTVGDVTFDTAKYCAIYLQKPPIEGQKKPFTVMSRRPGIGFDCIKPELLYSDKIYVNGKYTRLPDYFIKVLERNGFDIIELKEKRKKNYDKYLNSFNEETLTEFVFGTARMKRFSKFFQNSIDFNTGMLYNEEKKITMRKSL